MRINYKFLLQAVGAETGKPKKKVVIEDCGELK